MSDLVGVTIDNSRARRRRRRRCCRRSYARKESRAVTSLQWKVQPSSLRDGTATAPAARNRALPAAAAAPRPRSPTIDGLRGLAAAAVLVFHAQFTGGVIGRPASLHPTYLVLTATALGQAGVVLFFAISGLLIAGPFLTALVQGRPLPHLGRYAARRIARILPAYWLALFASIAIGGRWPPSSLLLAHLFLLHDLVAGQAETLLIVAWTLGIEATFYAAVPLVAAAVRRLHPAPIAADRLAVGMVVLWAMSAAIHELVVRTVVDPTSPPAVAVRFSLPTLLCLFAPGMLVALWYADPAERSRVARSVGVIGRHPLAASASGVLLVAVAAWRSLVHVSTTGPLAYQLLAAASGLIVAAAVVGEDRLPTGLRPLAGLGVVSYGLYLWHMPLLSLWWHHPRWVPATGSFAGDQLLWATAALTLTLPVAVASWFFVEKPCLQRAAAWLRRHPAPSGPRGIVRPSVIALAGAAGGIAAILAAATPVSLTEYAAAVAATSGSNRGVPAARGPTAETPPPACTASDLVVGATPVSSVPPGAIRAALVDVGERPCILGPGVAPQLLTSDSRRATTCLPKTACRPAPRVLTPGQVLVVTLVPAAPACLSCSGQSPAMLTWGPAPPVTLAAPAVAAPPPPPAVPPATAPRTTPPLPSPLLPTRTQP